MSSLVPGGNAPVATGSVRVDVSYSPLPGADIDVSAFALSPTGKVKDDSAMCFYGQPNILSGAVQMTDSAAGRATFTVDLGRLAGDVEKVALRRWPRSLGHPFRRRDCRYTSTGPRTGSCPNTRTRTRT